MKDEKPITQEELKNITDDTVLSWFRSYLGREYIKGIGLCYSFNDKKERKYLKTIDKIDYIDWSKVHGKMRRNLKFAKKYIQKEVKNQWDIWNKYCGQNVLYIHAKQGSFNWSDTTHFDYKDKEWYLDSCDDAYDNCYCDIYAKIKE
jgi:hypothetical protein